MSMYYHPQLARALTCERIREARGSCVDGRTFELPPRNPRLAAGLRRLFVRRPSPASCAC
jgi:hypothetical protein